MMKKYLAFCQRHLVSTVIIKAVLSIEALRYCIVDFPPNAVNPWQLVLVVLSFVLIYDLIRDIADKIGS